MDLSGIGDDLVVGNVRLGRPFDIVGISILGSHDEKVGELLSMKVWQVGREDDQRRRSMARWG